MFEKSRNRAAEVPVMNMKVRAYIAPQQLHKYFSSSICFHFAISQQYLHLELFSKCSFQIHIHFFTSVSCFSLQAYTALNANLDLTPKAVAEYLLITGDFQGFDSAIADLLNANIVRISTTSSLAESKSVKKLLFNNKAV